MSTSGAFGEKYETHMLTAITGGIGTGKSIVSQLLRTMGYAVYDCDREAKRLMNEDAGLKASLIAAFGTYIYNKEGQLDRKALAAVIFNDSEALERANAIIHPATFADLEKWKQRQQGRCFFESAILWESGFDRQADEIWSVSAPLELRISRVQNRDHSSREQILSRIQSQMPQDEKDRRAHHVIRNDSAHSVIAQVNALLAGK